MAVEGFDLDLHLLVQQPSWLNARTIYATLHGSRAYGTALPGSDLDVRGIAIAPPLYYHGASLCFEQAESKNPDVVVFDLRKFIKLAADCNPNALEILFTDPRDKIRLWPEAAPLLAGRDLFLSKKAKHTFSGYARAQLRRIQGHYRWLRNPPKKPPDRADFGLPEQPLIPREQRDAYQAAIQQRIDTWQLDLSSVEPAVKIDILGRLQGILADLEATAAPLETRAARAVGIPEDIVAQLGRERAFHNAVKNWAQYQDWQQNRNPTRAALEAKSGFDTKHAAHLVRLMRMGTEILRGQGCIVRRPDAEELLAIRNGAWTYEQVLAYADQAEADMEAAAQTSALPREPPRKKLDELCAEIITDFMARHDRQAPALPPTQHEYVD